MNDTTEWFTVEQIRERTHQITEGAAVLPCHSFVVDGGDETLLIDTGLGIGDLRSVVEDIAGSGDIRVLLTHSHWDHIGGANQFDDIVINDRERHSDGSVSMDVLEDDHSAVVDFFVTEWLELGEAFPDGFDPESYTIDPVPDVGTVEPGDVLTVGDRALELVAIPGHSPGLLAAIDRDAGICFGSDVVEPGIELFAQFTTSDIDAYVDSLNRLIELRDDGAFDVLAIGHGGPFSGDELSVLDDAKRAATAVANGEVPFERIDSPTGVAYQYTVGDVNVLTQPHEEKSDDGERSG